MATRPPFDAVWSAAQRIYPLSSRAQFSDEREAKVAKNGADTVGGKIALNINNPDPQTGWVNTCAVRMSYILNTTNVFIPKIPGKTVTGTDNRQYFFRVTEVIDFLKRRWGNPDVIVAYPLSAKSLLEDKKGMIIFEVLGWRDASGHATLWNGSQCYDHRYFNPNPNPKVATKNANFWSLP